MAVTDDRLESARRLFLAHKANCHLCRNANVHQGGAGRLCWQGTRLFRSQLICEDDYINAHRRMANARAAIVR